jgi:hypothetical protein
MPMRNDNRNFDENELRYIQGTNRLDANESIYFARELEHIKARSYDIKRAKLSGFELLAISTEAGAGAETITYTQYDTVGAAKIIANYADDLPRADVNGKQFTSPVRGIGISYGYSVQEIRASEMVGKSLDARKASAAYRGHEETINRLIFNGDSEYGLPGFFTNVNVPMYVIPANGTGATKLWVNKTPDQILADMNGIVNSVLTTTKGVHRATEVWLPIAQYTYVNTTIRGSMSDKTILQVFLESQPGVSVKMVLECGGAGAGATDRMVAFENNEDNVAIELPMMFMQHSAQQVNLEFTVPCESRYGGVIWRYPLSGTFADGI